MAKKRTVSILFAISFQFTLRDICRCRISLNKRINIQIQPSIDFLDISSTFYVQVMAREIVPSFACL